MQPDVSGTVCFYATDIAQGSLGKGKSDDSLARAVHIKGDLLMIWGRQDPHIPLEARRKILARLDQLNVQHGSTTAGTRSTVLTPLCVMKVLATTTSSPSSSTAPPSISSTAAWVWAI